MEPRDQIFHTTTPITVDTADGTAFGTGFFFYFCKEHFSNPVPALVTNKHVLEGAKAISFPLNIGDAVGSPILGSFELVTITIEKCAIVEHPLPEVDLCAILLGPFISAVKSKTGNQTGLVCLNPENLIPESENESLRPLESVVMIGYPIGLWDEHNNQPISRRGVLATRPNLDFQGRPEFLVDLACYPGSSGSPVFLFDWGHHTDPTGNLVMRSRVGLPGILYAGPMYDAEGHLHPAPLPTSAPVVTAAVPTHLGFVIKAQEILGLDQPVREFVENHV